MTTDSKCIVPCIISDLIHLQGKCMNCREIAYTVTNNLQYQWVMASELVSGRIDGSLVRLLWILHCFVTGSHGAKTRQ